MLEAEARGMPRKLLCLLGSYLKDRKIVIRNSGGTVKRKVYPGVLQGSILGSLLWNLLYEGLLKELQDIPRLNAVAFADELALILDITSQEEIGVSLGNECSDTVMC